MRFAHAQLLWLLLVFPPALAAFFWWSWRERLRLRAQFVEARLLPNLLSGLSSARRKIRLACVVLAVVLVILALARPQWGFSWEETKQRGLDIVVAIDTSKSMLAEDIAPNRLARAKLAALDLMQQARSDRLGLVAFAGSAFLQCPLTIDDAAFRQSVEALDVNIIPQGGTALAEAINTARKAFKEGENYKVLALFTDGEDNDEGALEAAQEAAQDGMRIFTIGIGTAEGELLRLKDAKDRTDYIRDGQGNVVKSRLNESLLQQIAGATEGGFYLPLRGAKTIDTLYEKGLAPLPKSEQAMKLIKRYHERYHWPLAAAIVLLLVEMLLPERRSPTRRVSRSGGNARPNRETEGYIGIQREHAVANVMQRAGSETGAPLALVVALWVLPNLASGSPSSALREYQSGKYDSALKQYQQALEKKRDDPRLHFNAGAAAYRATNYDAAIQHFNSVLAARDVKLQQAAYFNLGNTHYRLGAQAEDLDGLQQLWETAIKDYQTALALDKNDQDAAFNLAFVQNNVEQLKRLREAARRAKEAADEATRRREYHHALEIMENLLQQNPVAKQFEDYAKKLKDIDAIANPGQP